MSASAGVTIYTDRAAWLADLGVAPTIEDFNSTAVQTIADGSSINTGILTITRDGSNNMGDGDLEIRDGSQFGNIDGTNFLYGETGVEPHETVNISFNGAQAFAFGADFSSPFSGDGIGVQVDGITYLLDYIPSFDTGFFGIISNSSTFGSVSIVGTEDPITFQELWQADNLGFAVPAPASASLLALGALVARRRR